MAETGERTQSEREELTRGFLCSPLEAARALERQRELVEELKSRCARVTAQPGGTPGGENRGPERLWARLADETEKERAMARAARSRRRAVERAIGGVADPAGRQVLCLRYIQGLTWPVIQEKVGRSERTVYRLHRRAAAEVERLLWQEKSGRG